MAEIVVVVTNIGDTSALFDGRTVEVNLVLENLGFGPDALGRALQAVAAGPQWRMNVVARDRKSADKEIFYTIYINTDEEEDVVRNRMVHGAPGFLSCVVKIADKAISEPLWIAMKQALDSAPKKENG